MINVSFPFFNFSLTKVPTNSLETLAALASLTLDYNHIEVLRQAAFRGLVSLVRLSLYGNKIKTIEPKVFLDTGGNLTSINLGNNLLTSVSSPSFSNLTTLKVSIFSVYSSKPCFRSLTLSDLSGSKKD